MTAREAVDAYLAQHALRFEVELCDLLRIPSVSADSRHADDVRRAARWVAQQFESLEFRVEEIPTAGFPLVYAERLDAPGAPTVLVYGHYDVQPPDPLDEWISPPFEPTQRDGNLYARGATDDKGQMLTHVKSVEAWLRAVGHLPVNLKFLIEGEEEVGSAHLDAFVANEKQRLAADVVVISDTCQLGPDQPAITYALRGIAYYELRLTGPRQDLHSGSFGGAVVNPALALSRILAGLVDGDGRIQVPGFYDDVVPLTEEERRQLAALPFDERQFFDQIGVAAGGGETGYTTLERKWARPSYDINGLWSGYQGEGAKTVLPAQAGAKFSFRLVARQDPARIAAGLRKRIAELCPAGITWQLIETHAAPGVVVPLESPYMQAAARAIERSFGRAPVFIREGGSIPVVSQFSEVLGAPALLLGWGLPDDNTHSPNEKFHLADFHRGIRASAYLWEELSRLK